MNVFIQLKQPERDEIARLTEIFERNNKIEVLGTTNSVRKAVQRTMPIAARKENKEKAAKTQVILDNLVKDNAFVMVFGQKLLRSARELRSILLSHGMDVTERSIMRISNDLGLDVHRTLRKPA